MAKRTKRARMETLRLRLTPADKRILKAAAKAAGISVNTYVLNIALGDARRFVDVMTGLEELAGDMISMRPRGGMARQKSQYKEPKSDCE